MEISKSSPYYILLLLLSIQRISCSNNNNLKKSCSFNYNSLVKKEQDTKIQKTEFMASNETILMLKHLREQSKESEPSLKHEHEQEQEKSFKLNISERITTHHSSHNENKSKILSGSANNVVTTFKSETVINSSKLQWRSNFMLAIQANNINLLKILTAKCDNSNFKIFSPINSKIFTYPLHFALQHNLTAAANFILKNMYFDVDVIDSFGHSVLSLAMEKEDYKLFYELLNLSDLNVRIRDGLNIVHLAARMDIRNPIFLNALRANGANFNSICLIRGWTPLQYAAAANNFILTEWINENTNCTVKSSKNSTIVLDVLNEKHVEMAELLIFWGADLATKDKKNRNIFHLIAQNRIESLLLNINLTYNSIKSLLFSEDINHYYPIHYAAESDFVPFLIFTGKFFKSFNIFETENFKIFEIALYNQSLGIINYYLQNDLLDLEMYSDFPLTFQVYESISNMETLKLIFKYIFFKDCTHLYGVNDESLNILQKAVIDDKFELIKFLVEEVNFDVFDNNNMNDIYI